jgi:hypothetical protein
MDRNDVALMLDIPRYGRLKKFAFSSKELTELNSQILAIKAPTLPDEVVKVASYYLKKASKRWGSSFPSFLDKYAQENPGHNIVDAKQIDERAWERKLRDNLLLAKQAELDSHPGSEFALPLEKKYPLRTEHQIKTANSYFDNYYPNMELGDRLTFAKKLAEISENKGVHIYGDYRKYAELNLQKFGEKFGEEIEKRINNVNDGEKRDSIVTSYRNLYARREEFGAFKSAALLEAIDENWNGSRYYGKNFKDPLLATLKPEKVASVEVDGRIVTSKDLDKLRDKDLSDIMDKGTHEELLGQDGVDVFKSLPLPCRAEIYSVLE